MTNTTEAPVDLRSPGIAALLAWLVPGLGHLYQRRFLKAFVFAASVFGLFGWGLATAEGRSVYYRPPTGPHARDMKEFIGYVAQAGVGLATLPAILQHKRYHDAANSDSWAGREPLSGTFRGEIDVDAEVTLAGEIVGTLDLEPAETRFGSTLTGPLKGRLYNGKTMTFRLGRDITLGPRIEASPDRVFGADVLAEDGSEIGSVYGSVRRPLWDWYAVPPSDAVEQEINRRLGTRYDLAYVMIMIAGLLNFLAVYDAFDGPALGRAPRKKPDTSGEPVPAV